LASAQFVEVTVKTTAVIDGHVHFHPCYRQAEFFDAARRNLDLAARKSGVQADYVPYLLFTECRGDDAFESLRSAASAGEESRASAASGWSVSRTSERVSLTLRKGSQAIVIVAGRQVQCREGLEVLLLGTDAEFEDGRSIDAVLAEAAAAAIPHVIPWGAGKWFFKRGERLRRIMREHRSPWFFLGDEGGRPSFWPYPRHFKEGATLGVRDLPGTDPLPFPWDAAKVGRMGSCVPIDFDADHPWRSLRDAIGSTSVIPARFATLETVPMFVRNQAGMQLRKRFAH
jgi:hypothetical protein